jgi:predicted cobalt transporter CbtA
MGKLPENDDADEPTTGFDTPTSDTFSDVILMIGSAWMLIVVVTNYKPDAPWPLVLLSIGLTALFSATLIITSGILLRTHLHRLSEQARKHARK